MAYLPRIVVDELLSEERGAVLLGVREDDLDHRVEAVGQRQHAGVVVIRAVLRVGAHEGEPHEALDELGEGESVVWPLEARRRRELAVVLRRRLAAALVGG